MERGREKAGPKKMTARRLLRLENLLTAIAVIAFVASYVVAFSIGVSDRLRTLILAAGVLLLFIPVALALRIEQKTGYYCCENCGRRYVPTYRQVLFSMHVGMTRRMKCPHCGVRSWQKKVLPDDE